MHCELVSTYETGSVRAVGVLPDFACQTFARLLKGSCRYEQPKMFQPGRNPLLFACLLQK